MEREREREISWTQKHPSHLSAGSLHLWSYKIQERPQQAALAAAFLVDLYTWERITAALSDWASHKLTCKTKWKSRGFTSFNAHAMGKGGCAEDRYRCRGLRVWHPLAALHSKNEDQGTQRYDDESVYQCPQHIRPVKPFLRFFFNAAIAKETAPQGSPTLDFCFGSRPFFQRTCQCP